MLRKNLFICTNCIKVPLPPPPLPSFPLLPLPPLPPLPTNITLTLRCLTLRTAMMVWFCQVAASLLASRPTNPRTRPVRLLARARVVEVVEVEEALAEKEKVGSGVIRARNFPRRTRRTRTPHHPLLPRVRRKVALPDPYPPPPPQPPPPPPLTPPSPQKHMCPATRLQTCIKEWHKSDSYIARVLEEGFVPNWERGLPPRINRGDSEPHCPDEKTKGMMVDHIKTMVDSETQVVSVVKEEEKIENSVVSRFFCVPKPDGRIRPIINLRTINTYVRKQHFKMEGIKSLRDLIQANDFLIKIDLEDAFYHMMIHPSMR